MTRKMKISFLTIMLSLLLAFPVSAARTGSLLIKNIEAPTVLFHVADSQGVLTKDFSVAGVALLTEQTSDAAMAKEFQKIAQNNALSGEEKTPDSTGQTFYENLQEGFYLICSLADKGEFAPFILKIPMTAGDKTVYDVQAEPKQEDSTEPGSSSDPPPLQPEIPQTGYIQWPKYLLLALGVVCIAAGLAETFRGREKRYE